MSENLNLLHLLPGPMLLKKMAPSKTLKLSLDKIGVSLAVLLFGSADPAKSAPSEMIRLTPKQAVDYKRISNLKFSPDGLHLVCVVSELKGDKTESHLWMLDRATNDIRQFTFSDKSEKEPEWSPDGSRLNFLSDRPGKMQVFTIPARGGEARPITTSSNEITEFHCSPDGKQIAYMTKDIKEKAGEENDEEVADSIDKLERLFVIDVESHKFRQLMKGAWLIDEFSWLDNDRMLLLGTNQIGREAWTSKIYTMSISDCKLNEFGEPKHPYTGLNPSPARTKFAFIGTRTGGPKPHDLFLTSMAGGALKNLTASIDREVTKTRWQNDSTIIACVTDGFKNRLYRVTDKENPVAIDLPYSVRTFAVATDGTLAFVGVDFDRLPELFLKKSDGPVTQVSHLQHGWDKIELAPAEVFRCKSFDGKEIEAALIKPLHALKSQKMPLVLLVHGGPASNFSADYFWFNSWPQVLAARGYEVLMVNPRGSMGYGEEFLMANRGDWGGGDYKDQMAALDAVLARGETDPARLGIGGWSYGGEMTVWATSQTNRFKAAVAGGCVFDQAAEFETESSSEGDEWFFGTPWDHPEIFARNSPSTYISHARTPTLIVHGKDDRNNPVGQAQGLYKALKHYGVECQLVLYPGEGHLPKQEKHQINILERMLGWYDHYLHGATVQ